MNRSFIIFFFYALAGISSAQTFTVVTSFGALSGFDPEAELVEGTDGSLYGTAQHGGSDTWCNGPSCGTVFRVVPDGELTALYIFCTQSGCPDGAQPYAALVQATNGMFYGTTYGGGFGACIRNLY
jgi:uncharacterized repeat protein (TIGR03803 family)